MEDGLKESSASVLADIRSVFGAFLASVGSVKGFDERMVSEPPFPNEWEEVIRTVALIHLGWCREAIRVCTERIRAGDWGGHLFKGFIFSKGTTFYEFLRKLAWKRLCHSDCSRFFRKTGRQGGACAARRGQPLANPFIGLYNIYLVPRRPPPRRHIYFLFLKRTTMQPTLTERTAYSYDLPGELIAQRPAEPRDSSRLMRVDRADGHISGFRFSDIATMLKPSDLLVLNNTKVIPARLLGERVPSGLPCELLLLNDRGGNVWECLAKPGRRMKAGTKLSFPAGLTAEVTGETGEGERLVTFSGVQPQDFHALLDDIGKMPLPPYITQPIQRKEEYQTVYARDPGSSAAPTAGFHFTRELLGRIAANGTDIAEITLNVGLGTFRPVREDDITRHPMHRESYRISPLAADKIRQAKERGGRVVAVGTTSCRTLEAAYRERGRVEAGEGSTSLFLYPGSEFHVVDALVTNFHLPESTLIMLVCAFAGYDLTMRAYRKAVEDRYRFYSFGDAMFII